jgi:hypothetical protein
MTESCGVDTGVSKNQFFCRVIIVVAWTNTTKGKEQFNRELDTTQAFLEVPLHIHYFALRNIFKK